MSDSSNFNKSSVPKNVSTIETSMEDELAAYDQLPAEVRAYLDREARFKVSALGALLYIQRNPYTPPKKVVELLRLTERNVARSIEYIPGGWNENWDCYGQRRDDMADSRTPARTAARQLQSGRYRRATRRGNRAYAG